VREVIPQLQNISVLMVDTASEQRVVAPDPFDSLAVFAAHTHQVDRCTREQFPEVLRIYGVSELLPAEVVNELFSATNGHLKLTEQIARYENLGGRDRIASLNVVAERFSSIGSFSQGVVDLLVGAAVLGLSCTELDLQCVVDCQRRSELRALVEQAEGSGFVERSAEQIAFSHDVIRSAILKEQPSSRLEDLNLKLAECLAILRPGDYEARAQALLQARETGDAREMIALGGVAQIRRGVRSAEVIRRAEAHFPDDTELKEYLRVIAAGYSAVAEGEFEANPALRSQLATETPAAVLDPAATGASAVGHVR
jgi:hypothetical protein